MKLTKYEIDTGNLEAKKGATIIKMVSLQEILSLLHSENIISDIAVYLADNDVYFKYTCAFNDLPKRDQKYYEDLAKIILNLIESWLPNDNQEGRKDE